MNINRHNKTCKERKNKSLLDDNIEQLKLKHNNEIQNLKIKYEKEIQDLKN